MTGNRLENGTLVGWKAIARALDVSVTTAKDWVRKMGLPVYKLGGQIRMDVAEFEKWKKNNAEEWAKIGGIRQNSTD